MSYTLTKHNQMPPITFSQLVYPWILMNLMIYENSKQTDQEDNGIIIMGFIKVQNLMGLSQVRPSNSRLSHSGED